MQERILDPPPIVYGHRQSRTFRVLWMLEELEIEYESRPVMPHDPELVELHPPGKIPVMVHKDTVFSDSTAILQFLADSAGRFSHPCGTRERAAQDSLTCRLLDEFEACLWAAAKHSFVLPKRRRVPEIKPTLKWEFGKAARSLLAQHDCTEFVMGNRMTVPDFILTHCLVWAGVANFGEPEPALAAYLARMRQRPAFRRTAALQD